MLIQRRYNEIREQIQQGDVIAFSGKGHVSELIKLFTLSSVSHVAIVMKDKELTSEGVLITVNNIIESTTLDGFAGVAVNKLSKRLKHYNGESWWLPLNDTIRQKIDFDVFYNWLKNHTNTPFLKNLMQIMRLAGLDAMLKIYKNLEEALAEELQ